VTVPTDPELRAQLAAPPRAPDDPDLFTSTPIVNTPGLSPEGTPMAPASGPPVTDAAAVESLTRIGIWRPEARLAQKILVRRVPDPGPRAGLLALSCTVAAPLVDVFVAGMTNVDSIGLGRVAAPGRVVGAPVRAAPRARVVDDRHRAEVPPLLAPSLAYELLTSGSGASRYEEVVLHAIMALVHVQLLARDPTLARTGTELARRQNSLAIRLLNSRQPGSAELSVCAPDGPGTMPGGAPELDSRDFWSIPTVSGAPVGTDAPPVLYAVLERATGATPPRPLRYDDALGEWWSAHGMRHAVPLDAQWRAALALGLVDDIGAGAA
jgi:hypothetical protein